MRVKCINTNKLDKEGSYQSLKAEKEYVVLAIEFYDKSISAFSQSKGDFVLYRIRDDDGVIMPFPAMLFEITSESFPASWVPYQEKDGSYSILPKQWARENFWNDYYNDESTANKDLINEEKLMITEL